MMSSSCLFSDIDWRKIYHLWPQHVDPVTEPPWRNKSLLKLSLTSPELWSIQITAVWFSDISFDVAGSWQRSDRRSCCKHTADPHLLWVGPGFESRGPQIQRGFGRAREFPHHWSAFNFFIEFIFFISYVSSESVLKLKMKLRFFFFILWVRCQCNIVTDEVCMSLHSVIYLS